jgi:hypothetical protein
METRRPIDIKSEYSENDILKNKNGMIKRILLILIWGFLILLLVVIGMAKFVWHDSTLFVISAACSVFVLIPYVLYTRRHIYSCIVFLVVCALCMATLISTIGQGIHDYTIISFPVILIFSSLFLKRRDFIISSILALVAVSWLIFGESFAFFVPKPPLGANIVDFIIVAGILSFAIVMSYLLTNNITENMNYAFREIEKRKATEMSLKKLVDHEETLLKELQHRVKNSLAIVSSLLGIAKN